MALVQTAGRPSNDLDGWSAMTRRVATDFPHTELIAFPELHLGADSGATSLSRDEALTVAEPLTQGARHEVFARTAADLGKWLCPGTVMERSDDGKLFNTAVMYSPSGDLVSTYRKVFAWRPYEPYDPGDEFVVFDLDGVGRIGWSICYDAWWPETTRHLAWMGADLVLNLVKTPTVDRDQELVIARANAIMNQVFVASLNAATPSGLGRSVLVGPEGEIIASAPTASQTVLTAVIDLDSVSTTQAHGTAGLTRVWSHFQPDDRPIRLPLYEGRLDPARWNKAFEPSDRRH